MNNKGITIPEWTANEYRTTTDPFDWLYQYRDNRFVMAQLVEQVKVKAGLANVKNFVTLWKAYLATKEKKYNVVSNNVTDFDGQPVELFCCDYYCDESGIKYINRYGEEITVCRHPIMPVRRLRNIDTGEIKMEIAFKRGIRWIQDIVMDKTSLASSQKIIDLARYGVAVDSENAKELVKYFTCVENANYEKLGETSSVGRLGWIGNHGFSPYVDGVRYDGDIMMQQVFSAVSERGNYETWLDLMRGIRQKSMIAKIMIAASFSSVLVDPLGCLPFFVHVWGGTEAGKTVGLMAAASVWANPAMGEYIRTFNSTQVSQEVMAGFCNSLPMMMDELQIIKDRQTFDKTIYMLTEGIGKGRGAKSGGLQRTYTWKNCIITTGEMPISNANSGGGAVNRIIEVDCKDEKLFEDPRTVANTVRQNYGHAGKLFVQLVSDDGDEIKRIYQKRYQDLISGESTEKQAMAAAIVLTADELSTSWIFKDGKQLRVQDIEPYLTSKDDVDANKRALEWVYEFVATNPARFRSDGNAGELWGEIDNDCIYIIKKVFDDNMRDAGFNPDSFLSWAKRKMILQVSEDRRNTKKKRIRGTDITAWCVCISQKEDDKNVNIDELPF